MQPPSAWSRGTRRRLVFYPALLGLLVAGVLFCTSMPGSSRPAPSALLEEEVAEAALQKRDLEKLAGEIGERNVSNRPGALASAARWLTDELSAYGYTVERQTWTQDGVAVENLWVTVAGARAPGQQIVVGAHYDSAEGAPGANDNGTGVVALLSLARSFSREKRMGATAPGKTVRLVFFTNEEPPWFWSEAMGSLRYARAAKARGDDVRGMLSLETMGYFSEAKGSQRYPGVVRYLYPDAGDFLGFVAPLGSRGLLRDSIRAFRASGRLPSEGAALPGNMPGVGWSDHWAFAEVGYPAIMITDTAPFRYPHYHTSDDTPDKVDYPRLSRAVSGVRATVGALAR